MKTNEMIKMLMEQEVQEGRHGNGKVATYRRCVIGDNELTLIDGADGAFLYVGIRYFDGEKETFSTVTRLSEGRRDDRLTINGCRAQFASLIANRVRNEDDFFETCPNFEI